MPPEAILAGFEPRIRQFKAEYYFLSLEKDQENIPVGLDLYIFQYVLCDFLASCIMRYLGTIIMTQKPADWKINVSENLGVVYSHLYKTETNYDLL